MLGDLGGVTELIMLMFGFFLIPIAEHSFLVKTIRQAYMAKTRDPDLFIEKERYNGYQNHQKYVDNEIDHLPPDL